MTKEDIIRMAVEADPGFDGGQNAMELLSNSIVGLAAIKRFAALVAAHEREACAKVCDDWPNGRDDVYSIGVAIRARGEK
jgi:hypothetical protein